VDVALDVVVVEAMVDVIDERLCEGRQPRGFSSPKFVLPQPPGPRVGSSAQKSSAKSNIMAQHNFQRAVASAHIWVGTLTIHLGTSTC